MGLHSKLSSDARHQRQTKSCIVLMICLTAVVDGVIARTCRGLTAILSIVCLTSTVGIGIYLLFLLKNKHPNYPVFSQRKERLMKQFTLETIVRGKGPIYQNIEEIQETLGVRLDGAYNVMTVIDVIDSSNIRALDTVDQEYPGTTAIEALIRLSFEEVLGKHFSAFYLNIDGTMSVLINITNSHQTADQQELNQALDQIASACWDVIDFLEQNFNLVLSASISSPYSGIDNLMTGFNEALLISSMAFIYPNGQRVSSAKDLKRDASSKMEMMPKAEFEKKYFNAVMAKDFLSARDILLDAIDKDLEFFPTAMSTKSRVSNRVEWAIDTVGTSTKSQKIHILRELQTQMDGTRTISDLKQTICEIFQILAETKLPEPKIEDAKIQQVLAFIDDKLCDPNLDAVMICENVGISQSTLSHLFKAKCGVKMLDYIHSARIRKAKQLLLETDLSIGAIAAQLGYQSSWNMTRTFRRYEGITPSEFRKSNLGHATTSISQDKQE